jgi:hypothetical protein
MKFIATSGLGSSAQDLKGISLFDCSENEENFNESAEELSASGSHQTESHSTHNTSTTTQEEVQSSQNDIDEDKSMGDNSQVFSHIEDIIGPSSDIMPFENNQITESIGSTSSGA